MFTGLIEIVATINEIQHKSKVATLAIAHDPSFTYGLGDSIAVNGVCLTVKDFCQNETPHFLVDCSSETLRCSNLGTLKVGSHVNIERCLTLNKPLGGHIVSGHVDTTAEISAITAEGDYTVLRIALMDSPLVIDKGSIALDGISLTINEIKDGCLTFMLIPHTLAHTTLGKRQVGDRLNIEYDILGKYANKAMAATRAAL